jgi:hypothetical protein
VAVSVVGTTSSVVSSTACFSSAMLRYYLYSAWRSKGAALQKGYLFFLLLYYSKALPKRTANVIFLFI